MKERGDLNWLHYNKECTKKNTSGTYDTVYLESLASLIKLSDDSTVSVKDKLDFYDTRTNYYGTCSTAAATAAKVATVDDDFQLVKGVCVTILFTYALSVANPTLNVNSTGAFALFRYGSTYIGKSFWRANQAITFVYDGSYWRPTGNMCLADGSYYGVTKLTSTISTTTTLAATPNAVNTAVTNCNAYTDSAVANFHASTVTSDSTEPTDQVEGDYWFETIS